MTTSDRSDAMATQLAASAPADSSARRRRQWLAVAAVAVILAAIAYNASRGVAHAARIASPAVAGAPRPVRYLFGWTHWLGLMQIGVIVAMVQLIAVVAYFWRRYPRHPVLLMVIAATAIVWLDPVMNWAPYAVYNPQLWHWPAD